MADAVKRIERRQFNRWYSETMADADGRYDGVPSWLKADLWLAWQAGREDLPKILEELMWVRANYASGSTTEINARLDAAIAMVTADPVRAHNCDVGGICLADLSGYPKSCPSTGAA